MTPRIKEIIRTESGGYSVNEKKYCPGEKLGIVFLSKQQPPSVVTVATYYSYLQSRTPEDKVVVEAALLCDMSDEVRALFNTVHTTCTAQGDITYKYYDLDGLPYEVIKKLPNPSTVLGSTPAHKRVSNREVGEVSKHVYERFLNEVVLRAIVDSSEILKGKVKKTPNMLIDLEDAVATVVLEADGKHTEAIGEIDYALGYYRTYNDIIGGKVRDTHVEYEEPLIGFTKKSIARYGFIPTLLGKEPLDISAMSNQEVLKAGNVLIEVSNEVFSKKTGYLKDVFTTLKATFSLRNTAFAAKSTSPYWHCISSLVRAVRPDHVTYKDDLQLLISHLDIMQFHHVPGPVRDKIKGEIIKLPFKDTENAEFFIARLYQLVIGVLALNEN